MSGPYHPTGRGKVSARSPRALAVCDRCGFTWNHENLVWQFQWSGVKLQNIRLLVCRECLDVPSEQLRTIILPPDPLPVFDPRSEPYSAEVPSNRNQDNGITRIEDDGTGRILNINTTPPEEP